MLEVKKLCFSYYKKPLCLKDVTFSVQKNDKVMVCGMEGAGKSTLIKILSGFESSFFGWIFLDGKSIKEYGDANLNTSLLLKNPVFFENKSIKQNLEFLFKVKGESFEESVIKQMFDEWKFNLDLTQKVKKLSLFEKRKLAIIRSVLKQPKMIFLEDQFEELDEDAFCEMKSLYNTLLSFDQEVVFEISPKTYVRDREFFENLSAKVVFVSVADVFEFENLKICLSSRKNFDVLEYSGEYFKSNFDLMQEDEQYFLQNEFDTKICIPKKFNESFKDLKLEEIVVENVVLFSKEPLNTENFSTNDFEELLKKDAVFVCSKIDGRRLI